MLEVAHLVKYFPVLYGTWSFITTFTTTCDWNLPWIDGNHFLTHTVSFMFIATLFCHLCPVLHGLLFLQFYQ